MKGVGYAHFMKYAVHYAKYVCLMFFISLHAKRVCFCDSNMGFMAPNGQD